MREIERTLKTALNTPPTRRNKEKVKNHLLEVQRLLDALNALRLPCDEIVGAVEPDLTLYRPHGATIEMAPKEGTSSYLAYLSFC